MPNAVLAKPFGICERYGVTTGNKIRRAIERKYGKRVTQSAVAIRLKVPKGTLSEWLSDKYEPTLGSLRGLAAELDCSVTSLVGDEAKAKAS